MSEPRPISRGLWFVRVLRAYARRELLELLTYRMWVVTSTIGFVIAAAGMVFFARFVESSSNPHLARYGGNYLTFALVGFVIAQLQQVGVSALASRIRTAQVMGVLEAQMATPAPPWIVLGVAPVYEFARSALRTVIYFLAAVFVLDVRFEHANYVTAAVAVPLVLAAFVGLGLLSAGATMLARRANPLGPILAAGSLFLSGVAYPVTVLPGWLQVVGKALPLTHALEVLRRSLLTGASIGDVSGALTALAIFAVALTPFGLWLFAFALSRAREDGSLTHY